MKTLLFSLMVFLSVTANSQIVKEYDFTTKASSGKNRVKYGESIDLIIKNVNPFRYNISVKTENGFYKIPNSDTSNLFLNELLGPNSLNFLKEYKKPDSTKREQTSMASFVDTMNLIIELKNANIELISLKYSNLNESIIKTRVQKIKEKLNDESGNISRIIKLPGIDSLLFDNYRRIHEILNTSFSFSYNSLCESDFVKIDVNFIDRLDSSTIVPPWRNRILVVNQLKFYSNFGIGVKFIKKDFQKTYFLRGDTIDSNETISISPILLANFHCQYSYWEMFNLGISFNASYQMNKNVSSPVDIGLGLDLIFGNETKFIITTGFISSFNDYMLNPNFKIGDKLSSPDSNIPLIRKTTINPFIGFSFNFK